MRDKEARMDIKLLDEVRRENVEYFIKSLMEIHRKLNALMAHLGLEFEDIKPGIRVRKKR